MGYGEFCIQELAGEWYYPGGAVAVPSISACGKDGRLTGQRSTLDDTELTFSRAGIILLLLLASWEHRGWSAMASRYAAFLSYSQSADRRLAAIVQRALQRLGKP